MAQITKRKLDDALDILDESVRPPSDKRLPLKGKSRAPKATPTSTPALEALLNKRAHRSVKQPKSVPSPRPSRLATDKFDAPLTAYAPTSLPHLLARLRTFRLSTFPSPKPRSLSAPSLALVGWSNVGKDRLYCGTCGRSWVMPTPSTLAGGWEREAGRLLASRVEKMIVEEHEKSCPWRTRACPAGLYRLTWTGPKVAAKEVLERARTIDDALLVDVADVVHPLTQGEVEGLIQSTKLLTRAEGLHTAGNARSGLLAEPFNSDDTDPLLPSTSSLILALFGWALDEAPRERAAIPPLSTRPPSIVARSPSIPPAPLKQPQSPAGARNTIILCALCQRRVGTWSLTMDETPRPPASAINDSPTTIQTRAQVSKRFDVLREHRDFCPYIDPLRGLPPPAEPHVPFSPPLEPEGLESLALKPGWQVVKDLVLRYAVSRPSPETLAQAVQRAGIAGDARLTPAERQTRVIGYVRGLLSGR